MKFDRNVVLRYKCKKKHKTDIFTIDEMQKQDVINCPVCGLLSSFRHHTTKNTSEGVKSGDLVFIQGEIKEFKPENIYPEFFKEDFEPFEFIDEIADYDNHLICTEAINDIVNKAIKKWINRFCKAKVKKDMTSDELHVILRSNNLTVNITTGKDLVDHIGYLMTIDYGMVVDSYEFTSSYNDKKDKIVYKIRSNPS